jgi:transposase-like protein
MEFLPQVCSKHFNDKKTSRRFAAANKLQKITCLMSTANIE